VIQAATRPRTASGDAETAATGATFTAPAATGPAVTRLSLQAFRNYAALRLDLAGQPVVLTGPNGAGKTNLLEALSLLGPGRGLRRAKLNEINRQDGSERWAVAARVEGHAGTVELGTGLVPPNAEGDENDSERRLVRIDGRAAPSAMALGEHLPMAWLTPQMDGLFREGSSARRRFMDRLVHGFDAGHARRVAGFEKAMRERNRLLETNADRRWLDAQEETMAEQAVAVAAARREGLVRLGATLANAGGPFPHAAVAVQGSLETALDGAPALAVEDGYRATLAANRRRDAEAGGATEGPHRADLLVRHVEKDQAASLCSTGEQKALLLAITLAVARVAAQRDGRVPLLLLDEVAAHLDRARRQALFDTLVALGCQAWLTGTDEDTFAPLRGQAEFLAVREGDVARAGI
jgi:DNA replication and repair protein RecF